MSESEALADYFLQAGFSLYGKALDPLRVVLCFVNTCTVTSKAEQKCRRIIRFCVKKFPNALVLVSGCYAQLEKNEIEKIASSVECFPGIQKGFLARFPKYFYAELLKAKSEGCSVELSKRILSSFRETLYYSVKNKSGISSNLLRPKNLKEAETKNIKELAQRAFDLNTSNFAFHSRASLKVQDGCNSACSFCRIHLARGKSVSLDCDEAVARARQIEKAGKNEIVLTGVNLSQYNFDGVAFPALLKKLLNGTERVKFRISSFYPEAVDADFLEAVQDERICPYFHLSVQSGSERILKLMRRPYNVENIYKACENLRRIKDCVFLGADIIAGFPSETEEDFEKTFQLCKDLSFEHIHSFPFSARPGTEAYNLKPKVPERIAGKRLARLHELSEENYFSYLKAVQGKTFSGIVESFSDGIKILTENYLLLPLSLKDQEYADKLKAGTMLKVRILDNSCEIC